VIGWSVEFAEPTQNVRRRIGVPAIVGRSVFDLVDSDVGHPVQNALDGDRGPPPGQAGDPDGMPARESHVLADILSVEAELVRIVEPAWIAVGRARQDHYDGAGGYVEPPILVALRPAAMVPLTPDGGNQG
jgi:hypothetical protein